MVTYICDLSVPEAEAGWWQILEFVELMLSGALGREETLTRAGKAEKLA